MFSLGRQLAAGSDLWPTAESAGWAVDGHRPLAGDGESRRPKAVRNPSSKGVDIGFASGRQAKKTAQIARAVTR
jgi:hypothetical protein